MQIADMLSSRGSHACAVLNDQLYAVGGWAALKPLVSPSYAPTGKNTTGKRDGLCC